MTDPHFELVLQAVNSLIKGRNEYLATRNYYASHIINVIAPAIAAVEYIQSDYPQINRQYSENEISNFTFDQTKKLLFVQPSAPKTTSSRFLDELSMAAKGVVVDIISPALNFVNGEPGATSTKVSSSLYSQGTARIRQSVNNLKANKKIVEVLSFVRIVTTLGLADVTGDYQIVPMPAWTKKTIIYNIVHHNINPYASFTNFSSEGSKVFAKLLSPKSSKILNLLIAGVALRNGESLPCLYATAKLGYSSYVGYKNNENIKAIANQNYYLKKYVNAKNRVNAALDNNAELKDALGLRVEDSITTNTDAQLAHIYKSNPVLKKIFQLDEQEFKTEKDKIIFIQTLNKLIKTNDGLKGEYKIWQETEVNISEKKLKIATMHFVRHYKVQFNKYQKDCFTQVGNATILAAYQEAIKSDFMGAFIDVLKLASGGVTSAAGLYSSITSLVTATAGESFTEENKKNKILIENAILSMDLPEYEARSGTNDGIARIALDKQAEAMALEIMGKIDLTRETEQGLRRLYNLYRDYSMQQLQEDPLFSKEVLNPTIARRAYNIGAGLVNSVNPWGTKPSLPTVEEVKSSVIQQDKKEIISNKKFHKLLSVKIMQDIQKLSYSQSKDTVKGDSPTSVTMSASLETELACNLPKKLKVRKPSASRR